VSLRIWTEVQKVLLSAQVSTMVLDDIATKAFAGSAEMPAI
jgi:hypothetical protein